MTSHALLSELKALLHDEYDKDFSDDEVVIIAGQLVGYFDTLYQISQRISDNLTPSVNQKSGLAVRKPKQLYLTNETVHDYYTEK